MWFKFINSKWFERVFSASIAIICILIGQVLISKRDGATSLKQEFDKRPTFEYVDSRDNEIKSYIDTQDNNINSYIKQHTEESSKANENLMNYMKSMDHKIDIILARPR